MSTYLENSIALPKSIFIKFNEQNSDYPKVPSTMEAHNIVASLNPNNEFVWGQFTTKQNVKSISKNEKEIIQGQLEVGEEVNVYFYSRLGEVIYRAKLIAIYDNQSPEVYTPAFQSLVPEYYRHLCGTQTITETTPSIIYAYFKVRDLELLASGKDTIIALAEHILHYKRQVPVLTIRGMQALLYVSDQEVNVYLEKQILSEIDTSLEHKKLSFVRDDIVDAARSEERATTINRKRESVNRKTNHMKANIQKQVNGLKAERLVMQMEVENLITNGRSDLAEQVKHISVEEGDGCGYDIKSFSLDGKEKYIEVKGTIDKQNTGFFVTDKELKASIAYGDSYFLYRVFDLDSNNPKLCVYEGQLSNHFNLSNYTYKANKK